MNRIDQQDSSDTTAVAQPLVVTSFTGYKPPFDVADATRRMLNSVPPMYLVGLREVVLTNVSALNRGRRRDLTKSRKRKVRQTEARGLYHPAWDGSGAWIEIFVDNTLRNCNGVWRWFRVIRELELSDVLFHEIGHHIHFTVRAEYREKEDVADVWKVRLQRNYNRTRNWWLRRIAALLKFFLGPAWNRIMKKNLDLMLKRGFISRAEHEECVKKYRSQD